MSKVDIKSPALINAKVMAQQHAKTFSVPDDAALDAIQLGQLVKVGIKLGSTGERFWVEVTSINGDIFIGRIDNDLVGAKIHGLDYNDLIKFSRDNIYSTTPPP